MPTVISGIMILIGILSMHTLIRESFRILPNSHNTYTSTLGSGYAVGLRLCLGVWDAVHRWGHGDAGVGGWISDTSCGPMFGPKSGVVMLKLYQNFIFHG